MIKRFFKLYIITFLIINLVNLNIVNSYANNDNTVLDNKISAESYILIDGKSGMVISSKNQDEKLYPASTTKIMTAILALEYGNLSDKFIASQNAVKDIGKDGMNIGLVPGEEMSLEELLNALLVRSANDCANVIAENISPNREDFINLMNKRAKELGATNTNFQNSIGKDTDASDVGHLSTSSDLAKIARHAMTIPKFREIVSKRLAKILPTNKLDKDRFLGTTNKLLGPSFKSDYYSKVTGIKTGYTDRAGHNLVSSAIDKDGNELISVVLGSREDSVFRQSKDILEYGFKNLNSTTIIEKGKPYKNVLINNDSSKNIELITADSLKTLMPIDNTKLNWAITSKEFINTNVSSSINIGDKLGYIEYSINNNPIGQISLVSNNYLEIKPKLVSSNNIKDILFKILNYVKILGIIIAIILLLLLILRFTLPRVRRMKYKSKPNRNKKFHEISLNLQKINDFSYKKPLKSKKFKHYKNYYY